MSADSADSGVSRRLYVPVFLFPAFFLLSIFVPIPSGWLFEFVLAHGFLRQVYYTRND
jgi:hypothetical protein